MHERPQAFISLRKKRWTLLLIAAFGILFWIVVFAAVAQAKPRAQDTVWHQMYEQCKKGVASTPRQRGCYVGLNGQIRRR
jgi:hypothetical protein